MKRDECVAELIARKRPIGSYLDNVELVLSVDNESVYLRTADGVIQPIKDDTANHQFARFMFKNWQDVFDILTGEVELTDAFLQKRIRSNGYLTYVFPVLAMFQRSRSDDVPD